VDYVPGLAWPVFALLYMLFFVLVFPFATIDYGKGNDTSGVFFFGVSMKYVVHLDDQTNYASRQPTKFLVFPSLSLNGKDSFSSYGTQFVCMYVSNHCRSCLYYFLHTREKFSMYIVCVYSYI